MRIAERLGRHSFPKDASAAHLGGQGAARGGAAPPLCVRQTNGISTSSQRRPPPPEAELMSRMTKEELREIYHLTKRLDQIRHAAKAMGVSQSNTFKRIAKPAAIDIAPTIPHPIAIP
jgi:hypothetical protein